MREKAKGEMEMRKTTVTNKHDWKKLIARCQKVLRERFGVKRVVVFGSVADDAPLHGGSDLDLLVGGLAADRRSSRRS